ncbi:hypothetical protein FO519_010126, partial [Halicephalobus sp. NKZ332]
MIEVALTEALMNFPIDEGLEVFLDPGLNHGLGNYEIVKEGERKREKEEFEGIIFEDEEDLFEEIVYEDEFLKKEIDWEDIHGGIDGFGLGKGKKSEDKNAEEVGSGDFPKSSNSQIPLKATKSKSRNIVGGYESSDEEKEDSDHEHKTFLEFNNYVQHHLKEKVVEEVFNEKVKESSWYSNLQKFTSKFLKEKIEKGEDARLQDTVMELVQHSLKTMPRKISVLVNEEVNKIVQKQVDKFLDEKLETPEDFLENMTGGDMKKIRDLTMGKLLQEIKKVDLPVKIDSGVQVDPENLKIQVNSEDPRVSLAVQTDEGFESSGSIRTSPEKRIFNHSISPGKRSSNITHISPEKRFPNNNSNSPEKQQSLSSECVFDEDFVIKELELAILQNKVKMGILTFLSRSKNYDINF